MSERRRRIVLLAAAAAMVLSSVMMSRLTSSIERKLLPMAANDEVSKLFDPSEIGHQVERGLDRKMLQIGMPRSASDITDLAPSNTRAAWRQVLYWDLLFIVGYVLLFAGLAFRDAETATLWERPVFCALVTACADVAENFLIMEILAFLDRGETIAERRTLLALLIASTVKWLLYFLSVRAVSLQMEKNDGWEWIAVALRTAATGGSWTAILVLLGLPGRPLLSLMTLLSIAALFAATILRVYPSRRMTAATAGAHSG